ncbi:redox-regulated ATPase YchF [Salinarchaeum sp. IM2453]|uniref:redox-regulated ATPase YchF n=1 Tax=Salinarchaeum sp. IM2453 TaxID=2862870 RepID=UPI001C834D69|nr:redox-regulated ATPase YchF [Salinarchaeum sp. IM2453]QZA87490.1 redox-regulated ATPase YchF [Salinarchaeum sp. IM2453]
MITVALAGKPSAGKSTFFEAVTRDDVDVANYPFTTIDANRGVAHVRTECPCTDLSERCNSDQCINGKRYVPIELIDVAGLVPGAHEGKGLGNQFLDELTNADVIINVIDAAGATNASGEPDEIGSYDPIDEIDFIQTELVEWMTDILDRNWETVERQSRSPDFSIDDAITELLTGLGATEADVARCLRAIAYPDDPREWDRETLHALGAEVQKRTKPILIAANKIDIAPQDYIERLLDLDRQVVPTTAEGELALRRARENNIISYDPGDSAFTISSEINQQQQKALDDLSELIDKHNGTGVQRALNAAVYDILDQVTVYPVENASRWTDGQGNVLPDAHLLRSGSTPRDLAYAIHSDIGDGYLHAVDARENRDISDEYELSEGDVIQIVSTA